MAPARPLRDVFADLTGDPSAADDPAALLRDQGHPGLPDHLVAEAVVSYADTAPVEVAEHLAPYVTAHSAVGADPVAGDEPPAGWLELLGTAPDVAGDEPADIDDLAPAPGEFDADAGLDPDLGLDFGTGAGSASAIETGDDADAPDEDGLVEILADPAALDDRGDAADWEPAEPAADLTADLAAEESEDDGEPDGEPMG
jgi:hypothetical protein